MPVTREVIESDCKLIVRVSGNSIASRDDFIEILVDLDHALTILEEVLSSTDHYFYQICLDIADLTPKAGAFDPYDTTCDENDSNDPWCSFCPDFWTKALSDPDLRPLVEKFIKRFQNILAISAETAISAPSETDEVQLGEPLLAHLALTDLEFVTDYIGFLRIWDMDHEVEISGAVNEILARHGYCDEIEKLLSYCLLEARLGSDAERMFLRTFEDIHSGAPETILFRRYVVNAYRAHLLSVSEDCRVYELMLRSEGPGTSLSMPDCFYGYRFDESTAFGYVEHRIISEMQKSHVSMNSQEKTPSR